MEIKANIVLNEKDEEVVEFDCDYNNKDIVKSVGAKWNNVIKTWYLPYGSYSSLSQLMKINESGDVVFLMEGDLFHRYMDMDYQMQTATRLKRCGYSDKFSLN